MSFAGLWRKVRGRVDRNEEFLPVELAVARSEHGTVVLMFDLGDHKASVVLPRKEAVALAEIIIDGFVVDE